MTNTTPFKNDLSLPVVAAPMFLISNPKLVISCCINGIVGTFPALNQRTSEGFEEWVIEIKTALKNFELETGKKPAPFGVNLIVHPTNQRVKSDLEICIRHQIPLIITSLGAIPDLVNAVHSYGGLVYHDIIKRRHAEKAVEAGVDGLILVGEKGNGDEYGIGSNESFSVQEVAEMFGKEIEFLPERPGNRLNAEVITDKTIKLGWSPKRNLPDYIEGLKSQI